MSQKNKEQYKTNAVKLTKRLIVLKKEGFKKYILEFVF